MEKKAAFDASHLMQTADSTRSVTEFVKAATRLKWLPQSIPIVLYREIAEYYINRCTFVRLLALYWASPSLSLFILKACVSHVVAGQAFCDGPFTPSPSASPPSQSQSDNSSEADAIQSGRVFQSQSQTYGWQRNWGRYAVGDSDSVHPYFAIRIVSVKPCSQLRVGAGLRLPAADAAVRLITIGVADRHEMTNRLMSCGDDLHTTFISCGADQSVYGICSESSPRFVSTTHVKPQARSAAKAATSDTDLPVPIIDNKSLHLSFAGHELNTSAVHNRAVVSPLLSTLLESERASGESEARAAMEKLEKQQKDELPIPILFPSGWKYDDPQSDGFAVNGAVVGVAADLLTNTLRFYLNDKPLRVTARPELIYNPRAVPASRFVVSAVGEPYTMHVPELARFTPYIACSQAVVRAEFDPRWRPPPPSPPSHPLSHSN